MLGPYVNVIRRSHSRGSGMSPVFLDIVVTFALFRRSAHQSNDFIATLIYSTIQPLFCRAHPPLLRLHSYKLVTI